MIMAAAVWGHKWSGSLVCIQCDNAAVVAIVNSGTSRDQDAMHLLRCLAFIMAKFNFLLVVSHIRGLENDLECGRKIAEIKKTSCYGLQCVPASSPLCVLRR